MEITGKSTGVSIASSPFLEPLIDLLAGRLADVPDDPFATGIIVVPNVGVRDWLQRELCSRLETGIVANIQFMFVQQFLDTVFTASDSVSMQPWNIDHLTWTVHRAIDAVGRSTIPGALAKPLTVARVVADLFDRYGVHRPSMLRYWKQGRATDGVEPLRDLPDHLVWQQHVYVEVCRLIDQDGPADRLARLEERIRTTGLSDLVPEVVSLFGFVTMNTTMRLVVDALGVDRRADVYLLHPAPLSSAPGGPSSAGHVPRDHSMIGASGNPLLARWGRPIVEMQHVITGEWHIADGTARRAVTDLDLLRASIVDDLALSLVPLDEDSRHIELGDGSIQVHACHGRVRQVEVLRDAILHVLNDDPTLTLSDISIQCPDLESFAPIIPAVFRSGQASAGSSPLALDVSVSDHVLTGENPYHDTFWSILDLARSRCGVGEMSTLLTAPPVQRTFGFDEDVVARITDWSDALAVRFGLDTEHRTAWNVPDSITAGTWDVALDRLFMGFAVPAETPFSGPGGIVPFDDVSVSDAPELARLADFLTEIKRLVAQLAAPHSIGKWADIFESIIEVFFDDSDEQDFACRDLIEAISRLDEAARAAGVSDQQEFAFEEVSALLEDLVTSAGSRPRFRTGAITVTELLPQQGVPYRVIALLGASEGLFASGGVRGDDVLTLTPCLGDPMPTASGRLQLLDVVLAARDAVIITCDGADINNNKQIPLPVPIQELLEATVSIIASRSEREKPAFRVLTRHPRQHFASRSLVPGLFHSDRPFTFDPVAREIHTLISLPPEPLLDGRRLRPPVTSPPSPSSRLGTPGLRRALSRPADHFVQDVLGMRIPGSESQSRNDFVDFWPSSLEYARAGRELLDSVLRSPEDPEAVVDQMVQHMAWSGVLPPGKLGEKVAVQIRAEVLSILELLPQDARRFEEYRSIDIDDLVVPVDSRRDDLVIDGTVDNVLGLELIRASFTKFRDDLVLEPWIDVSLATCWDPEQMWTVRIVGRGSKGEGVAHAFTLAGADADARHANALRVLDTASTMMSCMAYGRVPYLPRTSERLARSTRGAALAVYEREGEYSTATQFLFGRVTWDDFVGEKPIDGDPQAPGRNRAERFARFVWDAFTETTVKLSGKQSAPDE